MEARSAGVRREQDGRWTVYPVGGETRLASLLAGWVDVHGLEAVGWTLTWETPADLAAFEQEFGLRSALAEDP